MSPHPLTNFKIQKYCQNEPRFNIVYCRDNLTEIKDVMSTLILELIGLLCMLIIMILLILIVLE